MIFGKKKIQEELDKMVAVMLTELQAIYKNKSSDEYKMRGDITTSPSYDAIERMIANLSLLKSYPKMEADDLKSMFNVLHRPTFKKMVSEYITEPSEKNVSFTAIFTVGYRLLVGELSRIYASTEATEKGIVYKPDKISRRNDINRLVKAYKNDIEDKLDRYVRDKMNTSVQESWSAIVGAGVNVLNFIRNNELIEWGQFFTGVFNGIFGNATELDPISYIDDILSNSYDSKVKEFDNVCDMYEATKEAYDEYMKIPEAQRQKKVESKYLKEMEKYNIKMKNLQAKLQHYDQRASEETSENTKSIKIKEEDNTSTSSTSSTTSKPSDDDFDF